MTQLCFARETKLLKDQLYSLLSEILGSVTFLVSKHVLARDLLDSG